ncbi:uncharacterized protein AMSG_00789 [Thecamonas trahens ATCC 50062]|uniref:Uncharacterized protein n=1 Tax=Thecamonas trahens ATCC 50062 TaxID=461836 RepID=A0A0L0DE80_THETB|nr:hypothetical protein AMSG_00789 [Thecamonas trahens ATCC 50062]KNC50627.1 hypothetical protein AMSG_00789 [Thecamonas trahens ATCC 50062]|eukprot:XP_013762513.1 hypothetical protein AMSG_00789 [Thecamonas trahens ATCC 50062]
MSLSPALASACVALLAVAVMYAWDSSVVSPPITPILALASGPEFDPEIHALVSSCRPLAAPDGRFLTAGSAMVMLDDGSLLVFSDDSVAALHLRLADAAAIRRKDRTPPGPGVATGDALLDGVDIEWLDLHVLPDQDDKHDLEAAASLPMGLLMPGFVGLDTSLRSVDVASYKPRSHPDHARHMHVLVVGSGSLVDEREVALLLHIHTDDDNETHLVADMESAVYSKLYAATRAATAAAELNIEGLAVALPASPFHCTVFAIHRANDGGSQPASGTLVGFPCGQLLGHLAEPHKLPVPAITTLAALALPEIDGVALTPTDLDTAPPRCDPRHVNGTAPVRGTQHCAARLVFLAAAEDTPSPLADGPVIGCAVGVVEVDVRTGAVASSHPPRAAHIYRRSRDGSIARDVTKYEGIVLLPGASSALLVSDPDATDRAAELCHVHLPQALDLA